MALVSLYLTVYDNDLHSLTKKKLFALVELFYFFNSTKYTDIEVQILINN